MLGSLSYIRSLAHITGKRLLNLIDPPVIVLIYHRVTTLASDPQLLAVSPDNFRAQMKFLKSNFSVLRFEASWRKVQTPAVVVTFDDGYADNVREALPILEEVELPATFFVSSGAIGTQREFWWDDLERIILGDRNFENSFSLEDSRFGRTWPTTTAADRQTLYFEIHPLMKKLEPGIREEWLMQLRRWARVGDEGREAYLAMTPKELRRLAQSSWVTIGAHTVTHTPLSSLPVEAQRKEIMESKRQLENLTGQRIAVFSYPFGCTEDYNQSSITLCRDAGFVKVAANFPGQAHRITDPFQIPRQLVRNWPIQIFTDKINGFWTS